MDTKIILFNHIKELTSQKFFILDNIGVLIRESQKLRTTHYRDLRLSYINKTFLVLFVYIHEYSMCLFINLLLYLLFA
jgi:hypothetical protein